MIARQTQHPHASLTERNSLGDTMAFATTQRARYVSLAATFLALIVIVLLAATNTATASTILVSDSFSGRGNSDLDGRTPDTVSSAGDWWVEDGHWNVRGGFALDDTRVKELVAGDRRALIDTGSADVTVSAIIKRSGGGEFQGVVGRYAGPHDWVMAFYDGVGDIVLGAKVSAQGGKFIELGRVPVKLKNGKSRSLSLALDGSSISVALDGTQIIPASGAVTFTPNSSSTVAGIFLRGNGSSRFDQFSVTSP